jgi:hypothetical protein
MKTILINQRQRNNKEVGFFNQTTRKEKGDKETMEKRGSEPFGTVRLSIENRENSYELTEESAQELKMAIRMAAKKIKEGKSIPHQISNEAGHSKSPLYRSLYRRQYSIALLGVSIVLFVVVLFTLTNEKEEKSWFSNTSTSIDSSAQPRLNLGSGTPAPDVKSLEEAPKGIIPVKENIGDEVIKGKTSSLKGRTRKIYNRKTRHLRSQAQPILALNSNEKEPLEQQLRTAFLLSKP